MQNPNSRTAHSKRLERLSAALEAYRQANPARDSRSCPQVPSTTAKPRLATPQMRLAGDYLAFLLEGGTRRDWLTVLDVERGGVDVGRSEVAAIRDFDLDASGGTVLTYGYRRHPATHFLGWTSRNARDVRVLARGVRPRGVALAGGRVLYQRGRRLLLHRLKGGTTRRVTTFTRARPRAGAIDLDGTRAVWATRGRIVSRGL